MGWVEKLRSNQWMVLFVCCFALFNEEFLYNMCCPLTSEAPAHIRDEHIISTLYGAYALGMFIATPILGIVTDRLGRRNPMVIGAWLLGLSAILFAIGTSQEILFLPQGFSKVQEPHVHGQPAWRLVAKYCVKDRVRAMGYAMIGSTTGSILGSGYRWRTF